MWNSPTKGQLSAIPKLGETESTPLEDAIVHLHFFIGGSEWYVTEFDGKDTFFGYAVLNGDYKMAEWGYFSFNELKSIRVRGMEIDCENIYGELKKASEIPSICKGMRWRCP